MQNYFTGNLLVKANSVSETFKMKADLTKVANSKTGICLVKKWQTQKQGYVE